jgi:hypothetical protein
MQDCREPQGIAYMSQVMATAPHAYPGQTALYISCKQIFLY